MPRWSGRAAFFAAVLLTSATTVVALDPRRPLSTYAVEVWQEGLPHQIVQSVAQGPDGALWIATYEGLARFNGVELQVFDRRSHPHVADWRIRSIAVARDGTLWAATFGGGVLRYRNGQFRQYQVGQGLPGNMATIVALGTNGQVWAATTAGLARMEGDRFVHVGRARYYDSLAIASDGTVYAGGPEGLTRVRAGRVESVLLGDGRTEPYVSSILPRQNGELWVATREHNVVRFSVDGTRSEVPLDGFSANSRIAAFAEDGEGNVWIAFGPGGVARWNETSVERLTRAGGLPNDSAKNLLVDRDGSLWIGTNQGLARIKDLAVFGYTSRSGVGVDYVRVVHESRRGGLWIGTYGAGLDYIDGGVVTHYTSTQLLDPFIRTLAEDLDGALWVGTGSGLHLLDPRTRNLTAADASWGLRGHKVNALLVRRDGSLLVAVEGQPLQVRTSRKFKPLDLVDPSAARALAGARVLLEGADGDLWIGTEAEGLLRLRGKRVVGRWSTAAGLPSNAVFGLTPGTDGELWIGTRNGLAVLHNGRIESLQQRGGLPVETIFQIIDDARGFLWLTTNNGVLRVSRRDALRFIAHSAPALTFDRYTTYDGMPSNQCNGASQPAGLRLRDGRLAIPTSGLAIIDPARGHRPIRPPVVMLQTALIDGRSVQPAGPPLPWESERFEFRYEGVSLLQPELVRYRYRLDGYDKEWIDAGTRRVAFYNSLPPGPHTFRVQARAHRGEWSRSTALYSFDLIAPPWRRWWAYVLYLLAAATLLSFATRLRLRSMRSKNDLLERRVDKRTLALQEMNTQLTRTTQDLAEANERLAELSATDGLTGISNRRRFDQVLETEWHRSLRARTPLSLIIVDVDHFKNYNDHYGHQLGDDCLRRLAGAMVDSSAETACLVARYGGEEFALLLSAVGADAASAHAERVRSAVSALLIPHAASSTADHVTISLGLASMVASPKATSAELVAAADRALYDAKSSGRNRVVSAPLAPASIDDDVQQSLLRRK